MIEKYYKYKINYENFIVMIKTGNFYEILGNDAYIMYKLFDYKIKKLSGNIKCGFPVNSLDKVLERLNYEHINYYVDDKDLIKEFDNNKYNNYKYDEKIIKYNIIRINNIINYLDNNILNSNILDKFEEIINGR